MAAPDLRAHLIDSLMGSPYYQALLEVYEAAWDWHEGALSRTSVPGTHPSLGDCPHCGSNDCYSLHLQHLRCTKTNRAVWTTEGEGERRLRAALNHLKEISEGQRGDGDG